MKIRCTDPNHIAYPRYGGRGITVCKRWHKFKNFLADMGEPPGIEFTLDRINNDKGYSPNNCRYTTKKEQNRNSRSNIKFKLKGKTKCLSEWAEIYRMPYLLVWDRVRKCGWDFLRALTEPVHVEKQRYK